MVIFQLEAPIFLLRKTLIISDIIFLRRFGIGKGRKESKFSCGGLSLINCLPTCGVAPGPSRLECVGIVITNMEDSLHILRDCSYARNMWLQHILPWYVASFFCIGSANMGFYESQGEDRS